MNGEHCQHDWRIDPRTIAASYPAKERLVCPICGAHKWRPLRFVHSDDPWTWERA